MKVTSPFLERLHLDTRHGLLTVRNLLQVRTFFGQLDDVQFLAFMKLSTDLSDSQIYKVFDLFDVNHSGDIDLNEFYLLTCMLIAIKDKQEKQFLFRHSRICFELLDTDNSKSISPREFETFGFLFNFGVFSIRQIFKEFDVSGDKELDYNEFRMFTFACIDRQRQIDIEKELRRKKKHGMATENINDNNDNNESNEASENNETDGDIELANFNKEQKEAKEKAEDIELEKEVEKEEEEEEKEKEKEKEMPRIPGQNTDDMIDEKEEAREAAHSWRCSIS